MNTRLSLLTALALVSLSSTPIYAANGNATHAPRDQLNSVNILNNTRDDIVYVMLSSSVASMYYGVKHGNSAKYHAKPGDSHTTFEVGVCEGFNNATGMCIKFNPKKLKNCVGNNYYNANDIDSITINSLSSCVVKCNDGTFTSCVRN